MVQYCAVYGCYSNKRDKNRSFFRFPKDKIRCRQWIKASSRMDLIGKSEKVINSYFICDMHFEDSYRIGIRLKGNAVPTLILPQEEMSGLTKYTQTEKLKHNSKEVQITSSTCSIATQTTAKLSGELSKPSRYTYSRTSAASTSTVEEDDDEDEIIDDEELEDSSEERRSDNKWSKPRHIGVKCTFCAAEIVGHRYKCVQCDSVDLCTACEAGGRHGDHCIIRIPNPEIYASLVNYIESIRRVLAKELSKLDSTLSTSALTTKSKNEKRDAVEIVIPAVQEPDPINMAIKIEVEELLPEESHIEGQLSEDQTLQPSSTLPKKQIKSKKISGNQKVAIPATDVHESDPLRMGIKIEVEELLQEESHLEAQIMALDNMPDTSRAESHTVTSVPSVSTVIVPEESGGSNQDSTTALSDLIVFKTQSSTSTKVPNKKRKGGENKNLYPNADDIDIDTKKIKIEKENSEEDDDDPDINSSFQTYGSHRAKDV